MGDASEPVPVESENDEGDDIETEFYGDGRVKRIVNNTTNEVTENAGAVRHHADTPAVGIGQLKTAVVDVTECTEARHIDRIDSVHCREATALRCR